MRGHCQCCGRDQAVVPVLMSKHGYQVKDGWFQGVCQGDRYRPIEVERVQADRVVSQVRSQVVELLEQVAKLEGGKLFPKMASSYQRDEKGHTIMVPYAKAEPWHQRDALKSAIWQASQRAKAGQQWADDMELLVNLHHGEPLKAVELEPAPARIEAGERRQAARVLVAKWQNGANVSYSYQNSEGKEYSSKMGVQAWRRLPMAA